MLYIVCADQDVLVSTDQSGIRQHSDVLAKMIATGLADSCSQVFQPLLTSCAWTCACLIIQWFRSVSADVVYIVTVVGHIHCSIAFVYISLL